MSDDGLTEATQRVMREIRCTHDENVQNGEPYCGKHRWELVNFGRDQLCPEAIEVARAAREDVADLTQQARADALEDFAHNRVKNQTAGRIFEDLLEHAAAIRAGAVP